MAAAPWLSKIGQIAGGIAPVLGGMSEGRAQGQQRDIGNQQNQAQLEQRMFEALMQQQNQQATHGANRAQFERDSPNVRFGQAMQGNLAANAQDVQVGVPDRVKGSLVTYSGGLRPSAIGPGGRAAGQQLADIGSSQMGKDTFKLPELQAPPQLAGLPKDNFLDKLLGVAGPATGFLGALGAMGGGQQQPQAKPQVMPPQPGVIDPRDALTDPNIWNQQPPMGDEYVDPRFRGQR